tara:strand:+ start:98 stop:421 length:324 start_codon:yes stop_codon:yes gene_type:complete
MGHPTLEEFRRWLQTEIASIESPNQSSIEEERLLQLETALQEAMAFAAAWKLRSESSIAPTVRERSVRVLSEGHEPQNTAKNTVQCNSCDALIDEDLGFCPVCGETR